MTELYACKYKICIGNDENANYVYVPVGTVFLVESINGNMLYLKPVAKTPPVKHDYPVMVSTEILEFGFTRNDTLI